MKNAGLQGWDAGRRAVRYRVCAQVTFWWLSPDNILKTGSGISRDISVLGLYVVTQSPPALGVPVELDITLPSLQGRKSGLRLRGEGDVVRWEGDAASPGFAVSAPIYPETVRRALVATDCEGPAHLEIISRKGSRGMGRNNSDDY